MDSLPVNKALLGLLIVVSSFFLVALWPLAVVWSVNTLFQAGIPYNLRTWAAVVVLVALARLVARPFDKS